MLPFQVRRGELRGLTRIQYLPACRLGGQHLVERQRGQLA